MEILEVSPKEYAEVVNPYHAFGTVNFSELNKYQSEKVYYLLFKEDKFRLGLIGGIKENGLFSPFSAPYGGFIFRSSNVRLQYLEDAIKLLLNWAREKQYSSINITLPPSFYGSSFISKQINCFWRAGFEISIIELNHSFNVETLDDNYSENIWGNARKNLRISLNAGLQFDLCIESEDKRLAYDIISRNREHRGHPLRMTWHQIYETIAIISADFFLVRNINKMPIASAIVFHITPYIVQVIYWGDLNGHSESKPMNFLSYKIFEYYRLSGKKIVDLGYSTENSVPNYGLSEFKESIGCGVDPKFTFIKKLL